MRSDVSLPNVSLPFHAAVSRAATVALGVTLALALVPLSSRVLRADPGIGGQEEATVPPPPISTDRPGNGNSPTVVPFRTLQLETSVGYSYDSFAGGESHLANFPTALRLGVARSVELRAGTGFLGVDAEAPDGEDTVHLTDAFAGMKVQALTSQGWRPNLGVIVAISAERISSRTSGRSTSSRSTGCPGRRTSRSRSE